MAEERDRTPSRARRERARALGYAAHSPDLTASAGFIAAGALIWVFGGGVVETMAGGIASAFASRQETSWTRGDALQRMGGIAAPALWSCIALGGVAAAVMVAAHQLQAGGLWAPARLAPNWSRLLRRGPDRRDEDGGRFAWAVAGVLGRGVRALVLAAAMGLYLWARASAIHALAFLDPPALARAVGRLIGEASLIVGVTWAAIALADLAIRYRRFEQRLQTTPEQQREEQKAIDGDPAIRSRRMQLARSWMRDPGELLAGTSLALTGTAGLTVLLAGAPPPGRVTVRTIARGVAASTLRHGAERAGVPVIQDPDLAAWFANRRAHRGGMPADLAARLRLLWTRAPRPAKAPGRVVSDR